MTDHRVTMYIEQFGPIYTITYAIDNMTPTISVTELHESLTLLLKSLIPHPQPLIDTCFVDTGNWRVDVRRNTGMVEVNHLNGLDNVPAHSASATIIMRLEA